MKNIITTVAAFLLLSIASFAQDTDNGNGKTKTYTTYGGNGALLSFGDVKDAGNSINNIPRFTFFFNMGTNYNFDFSENLGMFSGLNIKNIGLITEEGSERLKRRVYTLGLPIGFKLGELEDGLMVFAGGEIDLAFNYKEKQFVNNDKVNKFNEWFSDRTPTLMPSVFLGVRFTEHFSLKGQYYLNNFFNQDYTNNGVRPYENLEANLFFVSLGYNFRKK